MDPLDNPRLEGIFSYLRRSGKPSSVTLGHGRVGGVIVLLGIEPANWFSVPCFLCFYIWIYGAVLWLFAGGPAFCRKATTIAAQPIIQIFS